MSAEQIHQNAENLRTVHATRLERLQRNTAYAGALGVFMVIIGFIAISFPLVTSVAVQLVIGLALIAAGIFHGLHAFWAKGTVSVLGDIALGILYVAIGILMITNPMKSLVALTVLVSMFLVLEGVVKSSLSIVLRKIKGSGWLMVSGVVAIFLGVTIWYLLPSSALWTIGVFVGIDMIFGGWALMMLPLTMRDV